MDSNRIVILDGGYDSYQTEQRLFESAGYKLALYNGSPDDYEEKIRFIEGAVGLLVRASKIDSAFLDGAPSVRAIVRYGVGYENVDLEAASQRGVKVAIVRGYGRHAVSEHALALILACDRGLTQGQQSLRTAFGKPPRQPVFQLHNKTLGIVGLGSIGGALCTKARALFRRVLASDPYVPDGRFAECGAQKSSLGILLAESHTISLHCNLTQETAGLIDQEAFQMMRQQPILVNTARGAVVDEQALLRALNAEVIHSAGLDVFGEEPPAAKSELLRHPNVIATGHYAWYSEEGARELQRRAAENMLALLHGQTPADCLNP